MDLGHRALDNKGTCLDAHDPWVLRAHDPGPQASKVQGPWALKGQGPRDLGPGTHKRSSWYFVVSKSSLLLSHPSARLTMGLHKNSSSCYVSSQICCNSDVQILSFQVFFYVVHPGYCLNSSASLTLDQQCNSVCGSRFSSILSKCPNHVSRFFCILEHSVSSWSSSLRIDSFGAFESGI